MMKSKQTALEWLIEQCPRIETIVATSVLKQAKEIEKEQIKDAWLNSLTKGDYNSAEDYYNETFKSE